MCKPDKVQLGTVISREHRAKIDELVKRALNINAVIEQGVDLIYDQYFKAGLVKNGVTVCEDCGATVVGSK